MRILLVVIGIAVALWSGYWVVGSRFAEQATLDWLQDRSKQGWVAEYEAVNTRGFPNRFDTTITSPNLATGGIGWTAPFFQILSLSYKPQHLILIFPNSQTLAIAGQSIGITSDKMQASTVFTLNSDLTLDRANLVVDRLSVQSDEGWSASFDTTLIALRQTPARTNAYDLGLDLKDGALTFGGQGGAPLPFDLLHLDASATLAAPVALALAGAAEPDVTEIDLRQFRLVRDRQELSANGTLAIDDQGRPTGTLAVSATGWRGMLQDAVASGFLPRDLGDNVEMAFGLFAGLSASSEKLNFDLTFDKGLVKLGPATLGVVGFKRLSRTGPVGN